MNTASLINIRMHRGEFEIDVDFELPGEGITAILGPSGSGKTSLLRAIAGLERPQQGRLQIAGRVWFDAQTKTFLKPAERRVGMVFQDYALFEHMRVADNVGYGLPRARRAQQVPQWLERLHLSEFAQRFPNQLSGGQRQRVALARALAPEPDMLLLDEPFSAVDQFLRQRLRAQLQGVMAGVRQPVLLVTHDLEEARQLADYIGVMIDGRLRRFGKPKSVFNDPGSFEVARVLGWRNLLPVHTLTGTRVAGAWGQLDLNHEPPADTAYLGIRPEHLRIAAASGPQTQHLPAVLVRSTELGAVRELQFRLGDGTPLFLHRPWNEPVPTPGAEVSICITAGRLRALPEGRTYLENDRKETRLAAAQPLESSAALL